MTEKIVVTADRTQERALDTPSAVDTIDGGLLVEERLAPNFAEALAGAPGILVQKTSRGQGSPFLRGFTGFRTVTLIDGVRLNNSVYREGPNQYDGTIDVFGIDRAEVVRGPGSVLFGSDAVGGAVQVLSRFPPIGPTGGPGGGVGPLRVFVQGATAERSGTAHADIDFRSDKWAGTIGGTYRHLGDLQGGSGVGRQPRTGFNEWGFAGRAQFELGASRVKVGLDDFRQDHVPRTHRTIYAVSWEGTTVGSDLVHEFDQERRLAFVQLAAQTVRSWAEQAQITLSWQQQTEERLRVRSDHRSDHQGFDVRTLGLDVQLGASGRAGRFTWGVEGYLDHVGSNAEDFDATGNLLESHIQGPVGDDARYWTIGVYAQDRIRLGPKSMLLVGARFSRSDADADKVEDPTTHLPIQVHGHWSAVVGNLRAIHHLGSRASLYGGVSQGFRAPNLSDLTRFDQALSQEIETPTPDLSAEKFLTWEAGVKGVWRRLEGQASTYLTEVRGMIVRYPTGRVIDGLNEIQKANVGDGRVYGWEIEGSMRLDERWRAGASAFWTRGEADTYRSAGSTAERLPLSKIPPFTMSAELRFSPSTRSWIEIEACAALKQDRLSPLDVLDTERIPPGGTPGYAVLHLRGGLRFTRAVAVSLALENITNADYRIHGSGLNESGRSLLLAFRYGSGG